MEVESQKETAVNTRVIVTGIRLSRWRQTEGYAGERGGREEKKRENSITPVSQWGYEPSPARWDRALVRRVEGDEEKKNGP